MYTTRMYTTRVCTPPYVHHRMYTTVCTPGYTPPVCTPGYTPPGYVRREVYHLGMYGEVYHPGIPPGYTPPGIHQAIPHPPGYTSPTPGMLAYTAAPSGCGTRKPWAQDGRYAWVGGGEASQDLRSVRFGMVRRAESSRSPGE